MPSATKGHIVYERREVFANAPLELVAAELRFSYTPSLTSDNAREEFARVLRDLVPVSRLEQLHTFTLVPGSGPKLSAEDMFRLTDRKSTLSVSLQASRLVVETTDYPQFEEFRNVIERAVGALVDRHDIGGLERVGIRYIDEVRVPGRIDSAQDWSSWVDDRLIASLDMEPLSAKSFQAIVEYVVGEDAYVNFRFGAIEAGSAISSSVLRRRDESKRGPYFLLDIDSYWESSEQIYPFKADAVIATLNRLHEPAAKIFVSSITDRLRAEVLRSP